MKHCDNCNCPEIEHADEDYDAVGDPLEYKACKRPCLACDDCDNYMEP